MSANRGRRARRRNNVVSISGEAIPDFAGAVQKELVAILEDLVDKAKSGTINGVAVGISYADFSVSWTYAGLYRRADLIGALEGLKWELTEKMVK